MDNIRILHVLGGLDIGGIENLLMNVYHSIDREKIQFDFIKHTTASQFLMEKLKIGEGKFILARVTKFIIILYM